MDVPTRLTIVVPVDGGGADRLHLRAYPTGPTICGLPVLEGDLQAHPAGDWNVWDGSACVVCIETVEGLDEPEARTWATGGGV